MSSDLYHVDTEGNRSRVGHVGNGQLRVDLRELDPWTQGDIFRMIADIARDPAILEGCESTKLLPSDLDLCGGRAGARVKQPA